MKQSFAAFLKNAINFLLFKYVKLIYGGGVLLLVFAYANVGL